MLEQEALDRLQASAFKLSTVQKPHADKMIGVSLSRSVQNEGWKLVYLPPT